MVCFVCKMMDEDEELYGKMIEIDDIKCHHFCLFFSCTIKQSEKDTESNEGFLYDDIVIGVKKGEKLMCSFCKKPFALLQCAYKCCRKIFHAICGVQNKCLLNFKESKAYCPKHTGLEQNAPAAFDVERRCLICIEIMGPYDPIECIQGHCQERVWMHRSCLRKFALEAGYGLKCLMCQEEEFRSIAQSRGVYVPNRDIQWMLNQCEGASQDPSVSPKVCGAKVCISKTGKALPSSCEIKTCTTCGCSAHMFCAKYFGRKCENSDENTYMCFACDGRDTEEMEVPLGDEVKQEMVPFPGEEDHQMRKYIEEVYTNEVNYVKKMKTDPEIIGPRQTNHTKTRLNIFLNSIP